MEAFAKNLDDAIERIAEGALCSHQAPPGDDLGRDPRCADEPQTHAMFLFFASNTFWIYSVSSGLSADSCLISYSRSHAIPLRAASQNFLSLARYPALAAAFRMNEQRRLLIAEQSLTRAAGSLKGYMGGIGGG